MATGLLDYLEAAGETGATLGSGAAATLASGTVYKAVGVAAAGITYLRKYLFAICASLR